jgi:hypothetical protein
MVNYQLLDVSISSISVIFLIVKKIYNAFDKNTECDLSNDWVMIDIDELF